MLYLEDKLTKKNSDEMTFSLDLETPNKDKYKIKVELKTKLIDLNKKTILNKLKEFLK